MQHFLVYSWMRPFRAVKGSETLGLKTRRRRTFMADEKFESLMNICSFSDLLVSLFWLANEKCATFSSVFGQIHCVLKIDLKELDQSKES